MREGRYLNFVTVIDQSIIENSSAPPATPPATYWNKTMADAAPTVGFIGAGVMATAMIEGIIAAGLVPPERIIASNRRVQTDGPLVATGCCCTVDNVDLVKRSSVVVVSVKPDCVLGVLREVAASASLTDAELGGKCFISIAAGVPLAAMEGEFQARGVNVGVIRVMPNTPCCVGECAAGYAVGTHVTAAQKATCAALLGAFGVAQEVQEKLMDAVTGLSGSGPACTVDGSL